MTDQSLSALAEQLCRIEHKMDLILRQQAEQNPATILLPMNSQEHVCPVCLQNPTHSVDIINGHAVRSCGCATGKVPLNPAFAPGTLTTDTGDKNNGGSE